MGLLESKRVTDLLVIGGGPGGYVAALYAAKKGLKVTLIEKRFIGGTCLNIGCIPTKALWKSAALVKEIQEASLFGVLTEPVSYDMKAIQNRKTIVVDQLVEGVGYLLKSLNVEVHFGTATFVDDETVIMKNDSGYLSYKPKNIIIATGAKVRRLKISGSDLPFIIDSEKLLSIDHVPSSMVIIGGGIIGMEFAFIFGMLGCKVTVLEMMPQILPMLDKDIALRLIRYTKAANITVIQQAEVQKYTKALDGGAEVHYLHNGETKKINCELVLEAIGRIPSTDHLGIENTHVMLDQNKAITINKQMKTNLAHIYAIGDVTNKVQLAHVASHQAIVAVDAMLGKNHSIDYALIPSVIFTQPEIACVGMTEVALKAANIAYKVTKVPGSANGKAMIENESTSLLKLIEDEKTGVLIGAQIMGAGAENLIATLGLAIQQKQKTADLKNIVFAHPTTAEMIHEAALGLLGESIHYAS